MKKLLLTLGILVVLVITAVIAAPYAVGYYIEKNYLHMAQLFCPTTQCEARVVNFHRGWFGSRATVAINFVSLLSRAPTVVVLQQRIHHGPFLVRQLPTDAWMITPALVEIVSHVDDPQINLNIETLVHWNHSAQTKINAPLVISASPQQKLQITIKNVQAIIEMSADQKQAKGTVSLTDMLLQTPQAGQDLHDITVNFIVHQSPEGLWLGEHSLHLGSVNYRGNDVIGQHVLGLLGLDLKTVGMELQEHVGWQIQATVDKLLLKDRTLGPHRLNLLIAGVDAKALVRINEVLPQMLVNVNVNQSLPANIMALWVQLLNQGVAIDLKQLEVSTIWGGIAANGSMTITSALTAATDATTVSLLNGLNGNLVVEFPMAMLKDYLLNNYQRDLQQQNALANPNVNPADFVDKQISAWQQQGLLVAVGERYQLNVRYVQKQLWVNGKLLTQALPLP